ncbi:MAG: nucleotidyltransferase domain-containing protein [Clostridiales bacterium]|nr:nucleotidyltransferase domain-containing protein [Clostridiales bacterium]MCF8023170.1 nucleotidyltransferase domain-containing protein [Clostridiales bacterium]
MVLKKNEIETLKKYIIELEKHTDIDKVILFGSYAQGNAGDESDIDLAVISKYFGDNVINDLKIVNRALWNIPSNKIIQVHPFTPNDFNENKDFFIDEIIKTGITIYMKNTGFTGEMHLSNKNHIHS